jgi:uncharacterized protein YrrD
MGSRRAEEPRAPLALGNEPATRPFAQLSGLGNCRPKLHGPQRGRDSDSRHIIVTPLLQHSLRVALSLESQWSILPTSKLERPLSSMKRFVQMPCFLLLGVALNWSCPAEPAATDQNATALAPERLAFVQRATQLTGLPIRDRQNIEIGRIDDLVLDLGAGQVLGVLAAPVHIYGDYHVFIPAAAFSSATSDRAILNSDRTNFTAEPCITRDVSDSPDFAKKIAEAYTRFGAAPIWKEQDGPHGFTRFTKVAGLKMRNRSQENLGQAADLIVDLPSGRIVFLVASLDATGHSFYAVPPSALNLDPQDSALVLNADKASLAKAAQSGDFIWAQMSNPNWAAAMYRLHGQQPGFAAQPPPQAATTPNTSSENLFQKIEGDTTTVRIAHPPNYSDDELTRTVSAAIANESIGASPADNRIQVTTAQGRVTLRGQSSSADQKAKLRAIAETIAGRGNVDDQIQVAAGHAQ